MDGRASEMQARKKIGEMPQGERKMSVSPFLNGVIFTPAHILLALLSLRKNGDCLQSIGNWALGSYCLVVP